MLIFDKYRESFQIVGYKQFDSLEPLQATFLNNGNPIDLSQYYIRFECKKPDGNIVIDDENINIKNICEIEMLLNEQVTVINGKVQCEFVLVSKIDERQTSTFTFELDIQQSVIGINGYSSSLITVAERLHKDVIEARKLHSDLTQDIATGNQTKTELVDKTNIANTTINTLTQKTTEGNNTISGLVEKDATAKATNATLNQTIVNAKETDQTLNESNVTADTTNARLQMTIDNGQDSINKINATGNKSLVIGASQFVNNEYTWTHSMNNDNLIVNFVDSDTKEPLMQDYKIIDKNNILIRNSAEHPNIKVVLSASFYQGNALFGTNVEEFAGDSIVSNSKKVRLKDGNGIVENPITDSDAVFMPDGKTKLTKAVSDINSSLEQKANKDDVAKISSGTPLFTSSVSGMTDTTKNYVNTTDGYLYIYSGGVWTKTTVLYQSTGIGNKSVSKEKIDDSLNQLIEVGTLSNSFLGYTIANLTSNSQTTGSFVLDKPITMKGKIKQVKILANNAGIVKLGVLKKNSANGFSVLSVTNLSCVSGENILNTDIQLSEENLYIAINGSIKFKLNETGSYGFWDYNSIISESSDVSNLTKSTSVAVFGVQIMVDYNTNLKEMVNNINNNQYVPYKLERPTNGQVVFTVPINQKVVDYADMSTVISDSESTLSNVPCVLWLPTNYSKTNKKVPLVMMAHGWGEYVKPDGTWGTNQTWINWKNNIVNSGYAVFDVNGYNDTILNGSKHWGSPRVIEAYYKAYLYIIENYNVDEKLIVSGGSMGGLTALNFVNTHGNIARCLLAYAPCTDFVNQKTGSSWQTEYLESYGISTLRNVEGYTPINMKFINVPTKIWHGTGDTVLNYTYTQTLVNNLKQNNCPVDLRLITGATHDVAYGNSIVMAESLMFMNRFKV